MLFSVISVIRLVSVAMILLFLDATSIELLSLLLWGLFAEMPPSELFLSPGVSIFFSSIFLDIYGLVRLVAGLGLAGVYGT